MGKGWPSSVYKLEGWPRRSCQDISVLFSQHYRPPTLKGYECRADLHKSDGCLIMPQPIAVRISNRWFFLSVWRFLFFHHDGKYSFYGITKYNQQGRAATAEVTRDPSLRRTMEHFKRPQFEVVRSCKAGGAWNLGLQGVASRRSTEGE